MKSTILIGTFAALACLCLRVNSTNSILCSPLRVQQLANQGCASITYCEDDGRSHGGSGCAMFHCPEGRQIGYKEFDRTKPFPECCGYPICDM